MDICLNKTLWDKLAQRFNLHSGDEKPLHPDSAVNVYVGWPVFLDYINKQSQIANKKSLRVLDYGCGTGGFCKKLHEIGHQVVGIDISNIQIFTCVMFLFWHSQNSPDSLDLKCFAV